MPHSLQAMACNPMQPHRAFAGHNYKRRRHGAHSLRGTRLAGSKRHAVCCLTERLQVTGIVDQRSAVCRLAGSPTAWQSPVAASMLHAASQGTRQPLMPQHVMPKETALQAIAKRLQRWCRPRPPARLQHAAEGAASFGRVWCSANHPVNQQKAEQVRRDAADRWALRPRYALSQVTGGPAQQRSCFTLPVQMHVPWLLLQAHCRSGMQTAADGDV